MIRISHFQITTSFKTRDSIIWIFNRRKMYEHGRVLNKLFTLCSILRLAWTNVTVGRMFIFQVGQLLLKIQYTFFKKTCQVTIVTKQPGMINHCLYSLLSSPGTQPEMKLSCPKPQSANELCCSLGSLSPAFLACCGMGVMSSSSTKLHKFTQNSVGLSIPSLTPPHSFFLLKSAAAAELWIYFGSSATNVIHRKKEYWVPQKSTGKVLFPN